MSKKNIPLPPAIIEELKAFNAQREAIDQQAAQLLRGFLLGVGADTSTRYLIDIPNRQLTPADGADAS